MANITIEEIQSTAKEVQNEAVQTTQKAMRLQLGVIGLAYDALVNVLENSGDFLNRAIERGERIEATAKHEFEKYYNRAEEQVDTMQTRVTGIVKRAEKAVEENVEIATDIAIAAEAKAEAAAEEIMPELEAPIANYDSMTAKEVNAQLDGMTNAQLQDVKIYEVANQNRVTIVREVNSKMVELPVANYDSMTVAELEPVLATLSAEELNAIKAYEIAHENRVTLLRAVDSELESEEEATS